MTHFVAAVVRSTPLWVWLLLAALVALGLRQARDQTLSGARLWTLPLTFSVLSLVGLGQSFGWWSAAQPAWLAGVGLGASASLALGLPGRIRTLADGRYLVRASWLPMAVILAIFALRYALAVTLSMAPDLAHDSAWAAAAGTVYGLPAGLYAARAWYVTVRRPLPAACPA
jgi:hypothetical protein